MVVLLLLFALYHAALAVWMAADPHSFYASFGDFGSFNAHYLRDLATYEAAVAVWFAVAMRRAGWRLPVLGIATVQFALHSVNHLADIGASPVFAPLDFGTLLAMTLLLAWMWARCASSSPARRG